MLNATVGLDTEALEELGFELEPSPRAHLDGAQLVVSNIPPNHLQYLAVTFMALALLLALALERKHSQFGIWALGLIASCFHNIDNILRPGTYFTPSWIVKPNFAFPMDYGFIFWLLVMIVGVVSLHTPNNKIPILLHSAGTSFGIMHYAAQEPSRFSAVAHASILFEVIMGMVVGIKLLQWQGQSRSSSGGATINQPPTSNENYSQVPTEETAGSLEMQPRKGLRQRSRSPQVILK